jgi:thiamine pyrophosphate-dependent acetolactate synthase large subunit-like protein
MRADGVNDSGSVFGRSDFAAIAKAFGLRGANVTDVGQFKALFDAYQAQDKAEVWNIHVSDKVVSPNTRRNNARGQGAM